ncbi:MAG: tetratricopeptide repeat protein, partial [Chloroflexota bacterium]|nr:tetratricopeptide repeat protein [Chloroflexota bacterium]
MGRRKRKSSKRQSSNALLRNGLRDFKKGNYNEAIESWEQVTGQTPDMQPTSALAEAYFRRGLKRIYGQNTARQDGWDDLRRAAKLQPNDGCYTYHLGLVAHHQGDLDAAISAYQAAREGEGKLADRAAYPLALAIQQHGTSPADTPVWSALSDEEQAMLNDVETFQRRPYSPSSDAPLLWCGLAALDADDYEQARSALETVLENPANDAERRLAHYYQGVLAAKGENWDDARRQWNAARAAGLASPRLTENLGETYHRMAEKRLASDDVEGALAAAEEALRHKIDSNSLQHLISQAHQRLAYQAASAGDWAAAHDHWKAARETEGGSFRLSYNAALAHERAKEFIAAAEEWREALRRRPRRDDHPDAVTDEDVSQLWRRAAESYTRAGEYDEAVQVYRTAVKWDQDNLKARLALSEALLYNGQTQAAENELDRILERDPDNVPALLQQGEVIAASRSWWRGKDPSFYWERALALEPHNLNARQLLTDFHQNEAESALSWHNYARAVAKYEQALEYQPQNGSILAALGGCYLRMGVEYEDDAQSRFEQALTNAPANLAVYDEIIHAWLDAGEPDQAWSVMEQAEVSIDRIPCEFYVAQASYGIQDYGPEIVRPWLERAVEKAPSGEPILGTIGEMAMMADAPEIAQEYLERAVAADQDPGYAYLALGMLAAREGDDRTASQHWRKAERIARRKRDAGLLERVEMISLF